MPDKQTIIKRAEKRIRNVIEDYDLEYAIGQLGESLNMLCESSDATSGDIVFKEAIGDDKSCIAVVSLVSNDEIADTEGDEAESSNDTHNEELDALLKCAPCETQDYRKAKGDWREASLAVDRLRDKVSAMYGFQRSWILPVLIEDTVNPFKRCVFECLGTRYQVKNGDLSILDKEIQCEA